MNGWSGSARPPLPEKKKPPALAAPAALKSSLTPVAQGPVVSLRLVLYPIRGRLSTRGWAEEQPGSDKPQRHRVNHKDTKKTQRTQREGVNRITFPFPLSFFVFFVSSSCL